MTTTVVCDCLVVGTGPAGLIAAIGLAQAGFDTVIVGPAVDPASAARDTRTTALFTASVALLESIGVTATLAGPKAVPLVAIRLIDDTGAILRAPELLLRARELGLDAFGINVDNADLLLALKTHALAEPRLTLLPGIVRPPFRDMGDRAVVPLADGGEIAARLVVGADGRNSPCRSAAGITVEQESYPQSALATRFRHSRAHGGISTELHRLAGPLTTVPLAGMASSLVWVETPAEAARLAALPEPDFVATLEERLQGLLGTISELGPRVAFPLSRLVAHRMGAKRIALIGEAAHAIPPIGAQGLNLSLRDIATLIDLVVDARAAGSDIGAEALLGAYDRARRGDIESRVGMVDALNRSLYSGLLPLHLLRGAGLHALEQLGWLRRLVMQQGLHPPGELPRLMRHRAGGTGRW